MITWVSGWVHQTSTCSTEIGARVVSQRPVSWSRRCTLMVTWRGLTSGPVSVAGVEGVAEVVAGDHPERHRPAHVE